MNFITQYAPSAFGDNIRNYDKDDKITLDDNTLFWLKKILRSDTDEGVLHTVNDANNKVSILRLFNELEIFVLQFFRDDIKLNLKVVDNSIQLCQDGVDIVFNTVMSSAYMGFILSQIYHSYVNDNYRGTQKQTETLFCNRYSLFIINEMCYGDFDKKVDFPDKDSLNILFERMNSFENLLHISADIYFSSIAFALLHEISHAILTHDPGSHSAKKEIEADHCAFKLLISYFEAIKSERIVSSFGEIITDYVYLAPLYLLDFYRVVYYTGKSLCAESFSLPYPFFDEIHERKKRIVSIFDKCEVDVDENISYGVYYSYDDSIKSFLRFFERADKRGELEKYKRNK